MSLDLAPYIKHLVIGLFLVFFTLVFKLQTGSFLKISENSKKEVLVYDLAKRKQDISIKSLRSSCISLEETLGAIQFDLVGNSQTPCLQKFFEKTQDLSSDSAYYKIIEKMYERAYYYEIDSWEEGRLVYLYQNDSVDCAAAQIKFKTIGEKSLVYRIENLSKYFSCYCNY